MAKKGRKKGQFKKNYKNIYQRGLHKIAKNDILLINPYKESPYTGLSRLKERENARKEIVHQIDGRRFRPERLQNLSMGQSNTDRNPLPRRTRNRPRTYINQSTENSQYPETLRKTVCQRRRQRRIALFRTKRAGKGVKGPVKRFYNQLSNIRC